MGLTYSTYAYRYFYDSWSWFKYNNFLISHSNGTWSLLCTTNVLIVVNREREFYDFSFLARRLGNWQMEIGSTRGERLSKAASRLCFLTAFGYVSVSRIRAQILGATYVILHASRPHILCDVHENIVGGSSR